MEYHVPQFIEVEDKIVGPLTFRQFIYVAGAGGLCITLFVYLPIIFAFIVSIPVVAFAAALAFYKVNGKPFIEILEAGFNYYTGAKLFLWRRREQKTEEGSIAVAAAATAAKTLHETRGTPKLTRGKLSELAWSLDVKNPAQGDGDHGSLLDRDAASAAHSFIASIHPRRKADGAFWTLPVKTGESRPE